MYVVKGEDGFEDFCLIASYNKEHYAECGDVYEDLILWGPAVV